MGKQSEQIKVFVIFNIIGIGKITDFFITVVKNLPRKIALGLGTYYVAYKQKLICHAHFQRGLVLTTLLHFTGLFHSRKDIGSYNMFFAFTTQALNN